MLASLVEYIASIERPSGGPVALHRAQQLIVVGYPPVTTAAYNIAPPEGYFAAIAYMYALGDMEPDVFSFKIQQTGADALTGIITQDIMDEFPSFFLIVTRANPMFVYLTNRDVVFQGWQSTMYYLQVATEEDLGYIKQKVKDYGGVGAEAAYRKLSWSLVL